MKIKEIRELSDAELDSKGRDLAEELFKLKFQHSIRPLDNPAVLSGMRKDIAKVKTVMTERRNAQ